MQAPSVLGLSSVSTLMASLRRSITITTIIAEVAESAEPKQSLIFRPRKPSTERAFWREDGVLRHRPCEQPAQAGCVRRESPASTSHQALRVCACRRLVPIADGRLCRPSVARTPAALEDRGPRRSSVSSVLELLLPAAEHVTVAQSRRSPSTRRGGRSACRRDR